MIRRYGTIAAALLVLVQPALAASTRTIDADALKSSDHSKTYTLPASSDTLVGRDTSDAFTSKTIAGDVNTLSKLPVAAQTVQEAPSGTINGSNVTFTLTYSPPAGATVTLMLDGVILTQGAGKEYTISGNTITMATAPANAQVLWSHYSRY